MSFEPSTVGIGDTLKITIVDWENDNQEVAAVRIGCIDAFTVMPIEYSNCFEPDPNEVYEPQDDGTITLSVTVPTGVPPGEQTVAVYGHGQLELVDKDDKLKENIGPCVDLKEGQSPVGLVANSSAKTRVKSER